ncbi:hypothetical protein Vadar_017577 [Vaccinium darrowii]|uniref:Uncharacterized protein n=1 Tax=Vaccinium darrowii TaxID=229202 RepID=A0ACB7XI62_9ERIC|nr:hypothetical protein Vadar_017577 [Vaccinium darrowii]
MMERKGEFKESKWSEEEDDDEDVGLGGNQNIEFQSIGLAIYQKNSHIRFRVLLASTGACCEGISLVGASRLVLLDVAWNHLVERQAISLAYRIGQKKVVYIYRLIMSGTTKGEKRVVQPVQVPGGRPAI